jgi:hypothetical protein
MTTIQNSISLDSVWGQYKGYEDYHFDDYPELLEQMTGEVSTLLESKLREIGIPIEGEIKDILFEMKNVESFYEWSECLVNLNFWEKANGIAIHFY